MKKYTLINNKTGHKSNYTAIAWNISWAIVFICGMITGMTLF